MTEPIVVNVGTVIVVAVTCLVWGFCIGYAVALERAARRSFKGRQS